MTWRERVAIAQANKAFTTADCHDAESWATCAVGEQHAQHPHVVVYTQNTSPVNSNGDYADPVDGDLKELGLDFLAAVGSRFNPAKADSILDAIEARVLELKRATRA